MKNEEFFGLLGGIDSKMIEKASEDMYNWQKSQEGEPVSAVTPRKAALWLPIASVACAAAVVIGGFFLIRNFRQNGSFGFATDPNSSFVQGVDSDSESRVRVPVSTEISENSSAPSGGSSESIPAVDNAPTAIDNDPTKLSYDDMTFEAVDPVNDLITYSWAVEPDRISYERLDPSEVSSLAFEDIETSKQYLYDFFGNGQVLDSYLDWQRCVNDGQFECDVPDGTIVFTPVGGRVISVAENQKYFGNAVAVEIPGQKIFVIYNLDVVLVEVGDVVVEGQELGLRYSGFSTGAGTVGRHLKMVVMKKKTDPPEQECSESFDGLTLGISTNKRVYEFGEPIHITATVENNTGKDIYISYGGSNSFTLNPRINKLIEFPRRDRGGVNDDIAGYELIEQGEKVVQDFTFQTYAEYISIAYKFDGEVMTRRYYPDPDKPAKSGTYSGYLAVSVYDIPNMTYDEGKTYLLDFAIDIKGDVSGDETAVVEDTYTHYTEEMLKDYFIYDRVLYTNCYTCPVDWVIDNDRYGYNFDFSKVGELLAVIDGRANMQKFEDNTANVLPYGTEIYEFPDNSQLLIAKSGDECIPYMGMREG